MLGLSGLRHRLRHARDLAGFTQLEGADAAGVVREMISYWENDRRIPSYAQLARLAEAYGVSVDYLLGTEAEAVAAEEHVLLYRGLASQSPRAKTAVRRWLAFLDEWADALADAGETLPGRKVAPLREWRAPQAVTDSRLAPRLAASVRAHYGLGEDAIADLLAFLDQQEILVYRATLDEIGDGEGVSGLFYNHPRLGFSILVNTSTTPGRQAFTLAHEFAHALFHYQERGLVSRTRDPDRKERFADAFAAHFLVPGGKLQQLAGGEGGPGDAPLSPLDVVRLHRYFRVSYATMLNRLRGEGLLSQDDYEVYRGYSPSSLARSLGHDGAEYTLPREADGVSLGTYPPSILERVQRMILDGDLTPAGAAELLRVSQEEIQDELLRFASASDDERQEFKELPHPAAPRTKRGAAAD